MRRKLVKISILSVPSTIILYSAFPTFNGDGKITFNKIPRLDKIYHISNSIIGIAATLAIYLILSAMNFIGFFTLINSFIQKNFALK